jgi:hypothetical protein
VTLTINDSTMTSYTPAADTGREPAAAAGGWLTPAPAYMHPDGLEPWPGYVHVEPRPDDLKAPWDDPPSHAAGAEAGS